MLTVISSILSFTYSVHSNHNSPASSHPTPLLLPPASGELMIESFRFAASRWLRCEPMENYGLEIVLLKLAF